MSCIQKQLPHAIPATNKKNHGSTRITPNGILDFRCLSVSIGVHRCPSVWVLAMRLERSQTQMNGIKHFVCFVVKSCPHSAFGSVAQTQADASRGLDHGVIGRDDLLGQGAFEGDRLNDAAAHGDHDAEASFGDEFGGGRAQLRRQQTVVGVGTPPRWT